MWIFHDVDADPVWEVLCPAHEGREGAVFAKLAAWFRKVSERVPSELHRDAIGAGELDDFEKSLKEMRREIYALSHTRGISLQPPPPRPSVGSDRIAALIANIIEELEYLAAHPAFRDEVGPKRDNKGRQH